jgi:hypothetical protein
MVRLGFLTWVLGRSWGLICETQDEEMACILMMLDMGTFDSVKVERKLRQAQTHRQKFSWGRGKGISAQADES